MEDKNQNLSNTSIPASESFGTMPKPSEPFGNIPKPSETFGPLPHRSETFRTVPNVSERKENHTLTVREAARMFETAGVARTERSVINWCQPNAQNVSRLDAYFDPNERKYYITPQSVERAIQEELAKAARLNDVSEPVGNVRNASEPPKSQIIPSEMDAKRLSELEKELLDLKITNRGKDFFIDQLQKERDGFFNQLLSASRKVGELETKLLQLAPPENDQTV